MRGSPQKIAVKEGVWFGRSNINISLSLILMAEYVRMHEAIPVSLLENTDTNAHKVTAS